LKKFNKAIRILLTTNGLILVAGAMFGPIYALFVEEIGGDLLDASYAFGVFAFVAGIVTLLSGKYADKIKENELILVVGYGVMGIGFLGYIFVNSIFSLLIVQGIIGFGEAIYGPAFDVIYSKNLNKNSAGREWGAYGAMDYFTTALGAITGGVLVTLFGFNIIFVIMGLFCILSAIYILLLPRVVL
jgi:predicted MFS family arabinose efflux permease